MTKLPDGDDELVRFLRQYRSTPPPPATDLESKLMYSIPDRQSAAKRAKKRNFQAFWRIGMTIMVTIILARLTFNRTTRSNQTAFRTNNQEIENVLVGSWQEITISDTLPPDNSLQDGYISEADWLLLTGKNKPDF
jgi:hypothetical protein